MFYRYALPSRSYFSKTAIPKLYNEVSGRLRDSLSNIDYYSCTTDLWSSRTTDPYMSLTIHYIENWELQSKCLQVLYTPQDHTSENLKDALQDSLDRWNLDPSKLIAFTTDNGANIVKACQLAGFPRFQCFGHRLNLAVTNSIKDDPRVKRAIGVCRKLTTHFAHSHKKKQALTAAQIELNLPQHSLIADCETRWGSKFKMMQRTLEQEPAIRRVLSNDRKASHLVPTWQDVDVLEGVVKALEPVADFTDMLSGKLSSVWSPNTNICDCVQIMSFQSCNSLRCKLYF